MPTRWNKAQGCTNVLAMPTLDANKTKGCTDVLAMPTPRYQKKKKGCTYVLAMPTPIQEGTNVLAMPPPEMQYHKNKKEQSNSKKTNEKEYKQQQVIICDPEAPPRGQLGTLLAAATKPSDARGSSQSKILGPPRGKRSETATQNRRERFKQKRQQKRKETRG